MNSHEYNDDKPSLDDSLIDTGLDTTPCMWQMVSEICGGEKLPEPINNAIYLLIEGKAVIRLNNDHPSFLKQSSMMNVLSLFDSISAGRLALQRAELEVNKYYRSVRL